MKRTKRIIFDPSDKMIQGIKNQNTTRKHLDKFGGWWIIVLILTFIIINL